MIPDDMVRVGRALTDKYNKECANTGTRRKEITRSMDELQGIINNLGERVQQLACALTPVLHPPGPTNAAPTTPEASGVPLAGELDGLAAIVHGLVGMLQDVLDRLEV